MVFKRYIPITTTFSEMCIGALIIFDDLVGAIGSGILLAITIFYSYYEEFVKKEN